VQVKGHSPLSFPFVTRFFSLPCAENFPFSPFSESLGLKRLPQETGDGYRLPLPSFCDHLRTNSSLECAAMTFPPRTHPQTSNPSLGGSLPSPLLTNNPFLPPPQRLADVSTPPFEGPNTMNFFFPPSVLPRRLDPQIPEMEIIFVGVGHPVRPWFFPFPPRRL